MPKHLNRWKRSEESFSIGGLRRAYLSHGDIGNNDLTGAGIVDPAFSAEATSP
jgi:hypothetical protein